MNRRNYVEIAAGIMLAAAFFYWLYLRPADKGTETLPPSSPEVIESIKSSNTKVLVIGIDGFNLDRAIELINEGDMPRLARLLAVGARGEMTSTPPLVSASLYTTLATGVTPQVHGISGEKLKPPRQYKPVLATSAFRRAPALWNVVDRGGKSSGVINWKAAYPAEELERGVFVAEDLGKGGEGPRTLPPEWRERVKTAPPPKALDYEEELEKVRDSRARRAYEEDRMAFSRALEIMREERPDLVMVRFQGLEEVSRAFWKFAWPMGEDHVSNVTAADRERYRRVIEEHYRFLDRLIGGLLSEAEGYNAIIVSPYGMGPSFPPADVFMSANRLLEYMGLLTYEGYSCDGALMKLAEKGELEVPEPRSESVFYVCRELEDETRKWLAKGEKSMHPAAVEAYVSTRFKFHPPENEEHQNARIKLMLKISGSLLPGMAKRDIYWNETAAWALEEPEKKVVGIFVNLKDREPEGIIPFGDHGKAAKEVKNALLDLRTERNARLFERVEMNPDKEVITPYAFDPPDLLATLNEEALLDNYAYRGRDDKDPIPLAGVRRSFRDVSAKRTPRGCVVMAGEGIEPVVLDNMSPLDLAPTVLYMMGFPLGKDMPGKPAREIFSEDLGLGDPLYVETWSDAARPRVEDAPPILLDK